MLIRFSIISVLLLGVGSYDRVMAEESPEDSSWSFCPKSLGIPARPLITDSLQADDILITADDAELVEQGISELTGRVEITQDQQQVQSDQVIYNQLDNSADLSGDVKYWDSSLFLHSDSAHIELNDNTGEFKETEYRIIDNRGRGRAKSLQTEAGISTTLKSVDFSTCEPEDNFWKLSASKIKLDHVDETGSARNVVLKIKDVPVFYTPYISFPLSDKRKSGFLSPSFGSSNQNGFELRTPYYWNIAPNMDATLTPRLLTDSGVMMMGEYRYLFSRGSGELGLEYLPSDANYNDDKRNLFAFRHEQSFLDRGNLFLTYNRVSDKEYFEDFGNSLVLSSTRFLEQRATASYSGSWWNGSIMVQNYQTVDRTIPVTSRPYKRLPQVRFGTNFTERNRHLNFDFQSELVYFDRSEDSITVTDDSAYRMDLYPSVSYPVRGAAGYIVPKAGIRYTQYSIDNPQNFESSPSRTTPILSVDSGLFFDRNTNLFGNQFIQTLEPQVYYLYIPEDEQTDLPVFDTGLYDFSYYSLFRENRFSGRDRQGDANQFTLALTSRFIHRDTGKQRGFVRFGQIYYIEDRETELTGVVNNKETSSPLVSELQLEVYKHWNLRTEYQWNPDTNRTQKLTGQVQFNPGDGRILNMGYRVRRDQQQYTTSRFSDIEQSDISFRWPLTQKWSMVGRWNYAVPEERTIELFGGIEYQDCCWGIRAVARRYLADITGEHKTGIFLQLELKGLSGVGKKTSDFLQQNIRGYESEF